MADEHSRSQGRGADMDKSTPLNFNYDSEFDVLEILFREPVEAVTLELAEDVFAHVVPSPFAIVGLTIHHFTKHPSLQIPLVGGGLSVTPTAEQEIKTLLKIA